MTGRSGQSWVRVCSDLVKLANRPVPVVSTSIQRCPPRGPFDTHTHKHTNTQTHKHTNTHTHTHTHTHPHTHTHQAVVEYTVPRHCICTWLRRFSMYMIAKWGSHPYDKFIVLFGITNSGDMWQPKTKVFTTLFQGGCGLIFVVLLLFDCLIVSLIVCLLVLVGAGHPNRIFHSVPFPGSSPTWRRRLWPWPRRCGCTSLQRLGLVCSCDRQGTRPSPMVSFKGIPRFIPTFPAEHQQVIWHWPHASP